MTGASTDKYTNFVYKFNVSHFHFFSTWKSFLIISKFSVCLEADVIALHGYPYNVFRQVVEMNVLPERAPLFNKNLLLLQCMISCVVLPSCLSVFASKQGGTCKRISLLTSPKNRDKLSTRQRRNILFFKVGLLKESL